MSGVQTIEVPECDAGSRLDRWFKRLFPHIAHGRVEKLLRTGQLRVDGKRAKGNFRLEAGQMVRVPPLPDPTDEKKAAVIHPADEAFMKSLVIYEDADLIALNKPYGLAVTAPLPSHMKDSFRTLGFDLNMPIPPMDEDI